MKVLQSKNNESNKSQTFDTNNIIIKLICCAKCPVSKCSPDATIKT